MKKAESEAGKAQTRWQAAVNAATSKLAKKQHEKSELGKAIERLREELGQGQKRKAEDEDDDEDDDEDGSAGKRARVS